MAASTQYQDFTTSPRLKIAALWASMLFVFVYVDLFSLFRSDVRADIEAGEIFGFTIGQGYLLGVTAYVALPSLLLSLTVVLPARATRMTNLVAAALYALTVIGGTVGESYYYYVLGSVLEVVLLVGIVYYAWTWPTVSGSRSAPGDPS